MDLYIELLASTIRMSVPLILACLAGLWSERAGIVDIGLEGKMLIAAFVAASASGIAWPKARLASRSLIWAMGTTVDTRPSYAPPSDEPAHQGRRLTACCLPR